MAEKKKWMRPKLLILGKGNANVSVLAGCKFWPNDWNNQVPIAGPNSGYCGAVAPMVHGCDEPTCPPGMTAPQWPLPSCGNPTIRIWYTCICHLINIS